MVLPTILFGLSDETQQLLLDVLSSISRDTQTPFRVQMNSDDVNEAIAEIRGEKNVSLIVLGVDSVKRDKTLLSIRLGRLAMQTNRDHYVVYIIREADEVSQLLPLCARCAGVLICPANEKAIRHVFTPLLEDYRRLYEKEVSDDGRVVNLKAEGRIYRVRVKDIQMVQAVNKTIEFHTPKQTIVIYGNMDGVERMLGEDFIRCHRSYFVNRECIQYIDFRDMNIHLMDGTDIPLARSFKESMQKCFAVN